MIAAHSELPKLDTGKAMCLSFFAQIVQVQTDMVV